MRLVARAVLGLVLPSDCPMCEASSDLRRMPWCAHCAPVLDAQEVRPRPRPAGLPATWAAGDYEGALREGVLLFKDGTRRDLARDLADLLAGVLAAAGWRTGITLVPIPSARAAVRARGFDHTMELVRRVAARLPGADRLALLARPRHVGADQRTAVQRADRTFALKVAAGRTRLSDRPLVLVDDVATTGWTLAAATHALRAGGYDVAGAAVLAATLLRRPGSGE